MKRRRSILVLIGAGVLVALVAVLWPREKEPEYNGRTLTQWLDVYEGRWIQGSGPTDREEAAEAIRRIGTNALPSLVTWLHRETPRWRQLVFRSVPFGGPAWLRTVRLRAVHWLLIDNIRARHAIVGFEILGADGTPAIAELTTLTNNPNSPHVSERAAVALVKIGPNGWVALFAVVTNQAAHLTVRCNATYYLGLAGTNLGPGMQVLRDLLENTNNPVDLRYASIMAFEAMGGTAAREITLKLSRALSDPDESIRVFATNALRQISDVVEVEHDVSKEGR